MMLRVTARTGAAWFHTPLASHSNSSLRPGPDNRLGSVGSLDFFKSLLKGATLSMFPFSASHYQFLLSWNWLS